MGERLWLWCTLRGRRSLRDVDSGALEVRRGEVLEVLEAMADVC